MTSRILVTGGAGFIGSHLVDALIADDFPVTVLDDFSSGKRDNLNDAQSEGDLRVIDGSILDQQAIATAMDGCKQVYHLAVACVRASLGNPVENHQVNATGTLNVLKVARQIGGIRFIYCSTSEVYGNAADNILDERKVICEPMTVYGASKLAGEYYTKAYHRTYGMETIIVRPFNSYGPREHNQDIYAEVIPRFVIRVMNGLSPIIFGDGNNGRDFTYVKDTVEGIILASRCDALIGREINIARGTMITVEEVANVIIRHCQRPDLKPEFLAPRPGDVYRLHAGTRLAEELLAFKASTDFEHGIQKYLEWFNNECQDPSSLIETELANWNFQE